MFVCKMKNRSGSVSIVVVDKSRGRFREVRQFGVAHTEAEADALYTQAREWIRRYAGQQTIDFGGGAVASENEVDMLVSRISGARAESGSPDTLPETIKVILLKADGTATNIGTLDTHTGEITLGDEWYDLGGHKFDSKPVKKGVYINNGKKITIE